MLFKLRESKTPGHSVTYKKLLSADFEKLVKLTTIKGYKSLTSFLSKYDVTQMTRKEVETQVDIFLGKPQKEQPFLPGLEDTLGVIIEDGGKNLLKSVDNKASAWKNVHAGMGIFGAGMEFYKKQDTPDIEELIIIERELKDELKQIAVAKNRMQTALGQAE